MSQEFESEFEEIGCTCSGKKYKVDFGSSFFEDSLDSTREQSQSNRERTVGGIPYHPYTPQKSTGTQNNPTRNPSSSSHTVHTTSTPSTFIPPNGSNTANQNPPHRNRMGDDMKLPTFRGTGEEDQNNIGSYVKLYGTLNRSRITILSLYIWTLHLAMVYEVYISVEQNTRRGQDRND